MANFKNAKAYTFLDIETTHFDESKSAILQIAIVTDWVGGQTETWEQKIKPREIEMKFANPEALKINHYSEEAWRDMPTFEEVAPEIVKRLKWGPIIAHNAPFDIKHIRAVLNRYGWKEIWDFNELEKAEKGFRIGYPIIDTCSLAYLFTDSENQKLDSMREYYGLSTENSHDALKDTMDCREVFYRVMFSKMSE